MLMPMAPPWVSFLEFAIRFDFDKLHKRTLLQAIALAYLNTLGVILSPSLVKAGDFVLGTRSPSNLAAGDAPQSIPGCVNAYERAWCASHVLARRRLR
jgi:hypothetical protein